MVGFSSIEDNSLAGMLSLGELDCSAQEDINKVDNKQQSSKLLFFILTPPNNDITIIV